MDAQNPQTPPPPEGGEGPEGGGKRRLVRSRSDRVIGGVCGGVARYLGVDVLVVRIVAVALIFLAGLGTLLYVGGLLLIPDEEGGAYADTASARGRVLTAVGVLALVVAAGLLLSGAVLGSLTIVVPLAFLALAGLFTWWLVSGRGPGDDWRVILRRSLAGLGVLVACFVVFGAGLWASAAGGGTWAAALVIGAGLAVVAGAFVRPVRWLVLPAVSLGLGVGFASAAGIDLDGGVGEREYRPATLAEVRDHYEVGAGRLVVDLREARLPQGDVRLDMDVGMGEALVLVPEDVCVATRAQVGMGGVQVFDRDSGGIDVDWEDLRTAAPGVTRIVVDADVGLGAFEVRHRDGGGRRRFGPRRFDRGSDEPGNRACSSRDAA